MCYVDFALHELFEVCIAMSVDLAFLLLMESGIYLHAYFP